MPQARDEAGNVWETDAQGNAVRLVQAASAAAPIAANPAAQYAAPQAQADAARAQAQAQTAQAQAPFAAQLAQAEVQRAVAEAQKARAEADRVPVAGKAGQRPAPTAAAYSDAVSGFTASLALGKVIEDLETKFRAGPGSTSGVAGLQDYFGTPSNQEFDRAGQAARGTVATVLGFTGGQLNSATEAQLNLGPFIPSASDFDSTSADTISRLKDLQKQGLQRSIAQLGGVIDASGNVVPVPANFEATPENVRKVLDGKQDEPVIPGSALDVLRTNGGGAGPTTIAPRQDATAGGFQSVDNPALRRAHDDLVQSLLTEGGGRLDPQRYAQERLRLSQEFGINITNPLQDAQAGAEWATSINQYLDAGGRTVPTNLNVREAISARDALGNNLVNNPVGAAIIGAGNAAGFGIPQTVFPGEYAALDDAQGGSLLAGEIAGGIGGTVALGGAGRAVAGRAAPQLLQGGARGQFARNVATDAAYGGIRGGITEGDVATGAALGTAGSVLGQGAARGLGAAVGGAQRSAAAEALRNRGVPISVARQLGAGRAEDLASSIPFVGDAVRARQADSFVGFNQAAFQEGGAPIGANIPNIAGREGVDALEDAVGNAYGTALGGRSFPLDQQFGQDLAAAAPARFQLPDDVGARADKLIENQLGPLKQSGQLTGEMFQRAQRGLGKARRNANQIAGEFDQPYRDTLTGVLDAYEGLVQRGGGQDVIEGLASANAANKNLRVLEDASLDRAKIGTQSGEVNVFTPAQLLAATRKGEAKFGGLQGLRELGEQGQQVLPSTVPNSGTADRAAALGLFGGASALGGTAGFADNPTGQGAAVGSTAGLGTAASLTALAALLGRRGSQEFLEKVLISRPQSFQRAGQGIRNRRGLFGSSGSAIALNQQ